MWHNYSSRVIRYKTTFKPLVWHNYSSRINSSFMGCPREGELTQRLDTATIQKCSNQNNKMLEDAVIVVHSPRIKLKRQTVDTLWNDKWISCKVSDWKVIDYSQKIIIKSAANSASKVGERVRIKLLQDWLSSSSSVAHVHGSTAFL